MDLRTWNDSINELSEQVMRIYEEADRKISEFQEAAGLKCPPGCGACCVCQEVEATVLEVLPLAHEVFSRQQADHLYSMIKAREGKGDRLCILYRPDSQTPGNGECSYYRNRPLLCRLFGFAVRKNKAGDPELSPCKRLGGAFLREVQGKTGVHSGSGLPVYQEISMRLAALNPGMGFRRLPVNMAIKSALEEVYWRKEYRNPERGDKI